VRRKYIFVILITFIVVSSISIFKNERVLSDTPLELKVASGDSSVKNTVSLNLLGATNSNSEYSNNMDKPISIDSYKDYSGLISNINNYLSGLTGEYGVYFKSLSNDIEFGINE